MGDLAIRVEKLGKHYRISQREPYKALRDVLTNTIFTPFRRLRGKQSEFQNLNSNYIWALKDVSFEVKRGEVVGIIGRNGAGKSTLLKLLSRITEPTEGHACLYGRVGSLLEVGTGFHPELTGRENIYLNGAILGMRKAEIQRKFDEMVSFAEVERFIDTPVKYYSSGMYVRLAFSVAAHLEPEILLVDEVLAVGDFEFQKKCLGKIGAISQEGRTVLFVSHNTAAIQSLCQTAILLHQGQIIFWGDVHEGIDRYLSSGFIHSAIELDTDELQRPQADVTLGIDLRITHIRLHTPSGEATITCNDPISISITFRCVSPLKDAIWGFGIETADSVRLLEFSSIQSFPPMSFEEPGLYSSTGTLEPNPLRPGTYKIVVGARCAHKGLDYLPETLFFTVIDTNHYESLWMEYNNGLIRMPIKWTKPVTAAS